jgi:hypothetical protein
MPKIEIQSIVSARDGQPYVQLRGSLGQLTLAEARSLALTILAAAEAAEVDALIKRFVEEKIGGSAHEVAVILSELRSLRDTPLPADWTKEK